MTYISGKKRVGKHWPYRYWNKHCKYARMTRSAGRAGDGHKIIESLYRARYYRQLWLKRRIAAGLPCIFFHEPPKGLIGRLSPEQRVAALTYAGDDTIGDPNFGLADDQ